MTSTKKTHHLPLLAVLICGLISSATGAVVAWDEGISGDLSSDPGTPTRVSFATDTNTVTGTMQAAADIRDYWTFTLAPGQQLTQVLLQQYTDVDTGGEGNRGFHSINLGSTSEIPGGATIGTFLGGNHLDLQPAGTNILADLAGAPFGGTGFTTPLGPGSYTYLVQQTGSEHTGYTLDFVVVPEPASSLLLALTAALGLLTRRRTA